MKWSSIINQYRERRSTSHQTNDYRSEFEKDYHRIIGSASFRRLQDKTQVFPLNASDFVRTRLTHSLEVSSLAKSLGQSVGSRIIEKGLDLAFSVKEREEISDILSCAGLVHDIGNPPFGHFGEICIRQWFKENLGNIQYKGAPLKDWLSDRMREDLLNYEGNAQGLRVLTRLHYLIDEHGMNLTYGLLGTTIKYPTSSLQITHVKARSGHDSPYLNDEEGNIARKKLGYFFSEEELFLDIQERCGLDGCRSPLAFLLEAADDIAYKTADIEDAYKKGFIKYQDLVRELMADDGPGKAEEVSERKDAHKPGKTGEDDNTCGKVDGMQAALNILKDMYRTGLEKQPEDPELYAVQNWVVRLQGYLLNIAAEGFVSHYGEIMTGEYGYDLFHGSPAETLMDLLGDMGWRYVFDSEFIYKQELRTGEIYEFLLGRFVKAVLYYDTDEWENRRSPIDHKLMALVSENYKRAYACRAAGCDEGERLYLRMLLVTDFISGMTDSHACGFYREMRGVLA